MKLTPIDNNPFWMDSYNRLFVGIDEKPVELKFSVHQNELLQKFMTAEDTEEEKEAAEKAVKGKDADKTNFVINMKIEHAYKLVQIALNPKKDQIDYTIDDVKEIFEEDLDLLQILGKLWLEKKALSPELDEILNPLLAPRRKQAA